MDCPASWRLARYFGVDRAGAQSFQSVLFVGASVLLLAAFGLWRRTVL